ncbi:hypothetical protein IFO70_32720 [Phormidium tenue FACHB-886]|nr:hypothetical protein [Phormidium tenue FACHB-886]
MEVLTAQAEVNPGMTIADLWIEAKILCPRLPAKSQFYQWLRICWIHDPQPRGGCKLPSKYTQRHLNRIVKLYQFKQQVGSLKAAQQKLLEEMKEQPELYFEDSNNG